MERRFLGLPRQVAAAYLTLFVLSGIGYAVAWPQAPVLAGDSHQYFEVARDLADNHMHSLHDRPAGYPLVLVLTGSIERPTRALFYLSMGFHFLSLWLLAMVLHRLGASRLSVLLFALVLLLPPFMERAAYALTESLSELTLALALAGIVLWYLGAGVGWLAAGALSTGYAALVRPTYQALAPALAVTLILFAVILRKRAEWGRIVRAGAALLILGLGPVLAYSTFNWKRFGLFGITPLLGFNLSTRTVPVVERLPEEYRAVRSELIRVRDLSLTKRGGSHTGLQYIYAARPFLAKITGLGPVELSRYMMRLNLRLIREAPLSYLLQVLNATGAYWNAGAVEIAGFGSPYLMLLWIALYFGLLGVAAVQFVIVAGVSLLRLGAGWRSGVGAGPWMDLAMPESAALAYLLSVMIVFYTMVISCAVDVGDPRHRAPTEALIAFAAVIGIETCGRWVRAGKPTASPSTIGG